MKWTKRMAAVLVVVALGACGGEESPGAGSEAAEPTGGMEGMDGMEGISGMQMSAGMMEQMQAHMRQMQDASGDQIRAGLSRHRQMVANLISQMNREMRDMNMAADPEWSATIDAIREDLVRLPEMSAGELETFMPEHGERVGRLMEMHRSMMADMRR